jgi:hypothetical protein
MCRPLLQVAWTGSSSLDIIMRLQQTHLPEPSLVALFSFGRHMDSDTGIRMGMHPKPEDKQLGWPLRGLLVTCASAKSAAG